MTLPKKKVFLTKKGRRQDKLPQPPKLGLLRRWRQAMRTHPAITGIWSLLGFLGLVASLLGGADLILGGPPWPLEPDIVARDANDGSFTILPFTIINRSGGFPIRSINLNCYVDLAYIMDANRKTIIIRDAVLQSGITIMDNQISYYCNSDILHVEDDGSLIIGYKNGQFLQTKPGIFKGPVTVLKLCVMVSGTYKIFGFEKPFHSTMFQWPISPSDHQWIKGPIAFDTDQSRWIPKFSTLGAVYALRSMMETDPAKKGELGPKALLCDPVNN